MVVLTLVLIAIIILRQIHSFTPLQNLILELVDWVIWFVFLLELIILTSISKNKIHYLTSHWFDVMIVILPPLRVLRLFKLFALEETARPLVRIFPLFAKAIIETRRFISKHKFKYVIMVLFIMVLFLGSLTFIFESQHEGSNIRTLFDAVWWTIETVTTIGYGDFYPTTFGGRLIALVLMAFGITGFSLLTAKLASYLIGEQEEKVEEDIMERLDRMEKKIDRIGRAKKG